MGQSGGDEKVGSLFIRQPERPIHSLNDLQGHRFAFGDVNSTSGHLMPAYFMQQEGVDRTVIDKALYTGGHDATPLAGANSKSDAGADDGTGFWRGDQGGGLNYNPGRGVYRTPPIVAVFM